MYIDPRNPQLQKFQAAKNARKERAIMRKQIHEANPKLSPKQIDQVVDARIALLEQQAVRDQEAARKTRRPHNGAPKKQPQIANRALAIALEPIAPSITVTKKQ